MIPKRLVFAIAAALALFSCVYETSQGSTAQASSSAESHAIAILHGTTTASASASATATASTGSCKCENKCGENEIATQCKPCEQICGEEPRFCIAECIKGHFCACAAGFCRDKYTGKCRKDCPENEMYTECEPICELQCGKPAKICPAICKLGHYCTCKPDTCRNHLGKCVRINSTGHVCPKNEEYTQCEPICEPVCGEDPKPCPKICKPGHFCKCKSGYCRDPKTGRCVKECPKNEVFTECSPICEPVCGEKPRACPFVCLPGKYCECKPGLCRDPKTGRCIKECPKHEKYTQCKPICELKCGEKPGACIQVCYEGDYCECEKGYCRNRLGKCVEIKNNCTGHLCPKNERYTECEPRCEPICGEEPELCSEICIPGHFCECLEGFCRDPYSGDCIKKCPKNEEYTECKPICERKCGEKTNPLTCPKICIKGAYCRCKPEFCRDPKTGRCIKECPKNEQYTECKPICEKKCNEKPKACPAICILGDYCTCKEKYCRDCNGECVKEKACPFENSHCSDRCDRCDH